MNTIYNGTPDSRLYKEVLGKTIGELLEADEKVVYLDADLMSCIGTAKLPEKFDRAVNCGIAESNMIGIAGGVAAAGLKPIADEIEFLPFWEKGVRFFKVLDPNNAPVEFCQIL